MERTYKYMPNEFEQKMPSLSEDLLEFYDAYEQYEKTRDTLDLINLKGKLDDISITIKHRKLNGNITEDYGNEMEKYLGEFLNDGKKLS